jgi:hypothetical protein
MSGNSGKVTSGQTAPPGGQAYFHLTYVPNAVNIANNDDPNKDPNTDGPFVGWWLYPDATAPVPAQQTVMSEGAATIITAGIGWDEERGGPRHLQHRPGFAGLQAALIAPHR